MALAVRGTVARSKRLCINRSDSRGGQESYPAPPPALKSDLLPWGSQGLPVGAKNKKPKLENRLSAGERQEETGPGRG